MSDQEDRPLTPSVLPGVAEYHRENNMERVVFAIVPMTAVAHNLVLPPGTPIHFDFMEPEPYKKMVKMVLKEKQYVVKVQGSEMATTLIPTSGWEDVSAADKVMYRVEKRLGG